MSKGGSRRGSVDSDDRSLSEQLVSGSSHDSADSSALFKRFLIDAVKQSKDQNSVDEELKRRIEAAVNLVMTKRRTLVSEGRTPPPSIGVVEQSGPNHPKSDAVSSEDSVSFLGGGSDNEGSIVSKIDNRRKHRGSVSSEDIGVGKKVKLSNISGDQEGDDGLDKDFKKSLNEILIDRNYPDIDQLLCALKKKDSAKKDDLLNQRLDLFLGNYQTCSPEEKYLRYDGHNEKDALLLGEFGGVTALYRGRYDFNAYSKQQQSLIKDQNFLERIKDSEPGNALVGMVKVANYRERNESGRPGETLNCAYGFFEDGRSIVASQSFFDKEELEELQEKEKKVFEDCLDGLITERRSNAIEGLQSLVVSEDGVLNLDEKLLNMLQISSEDRKQIQLENIIKKIQSDGLKSLSGINADRSHILELLFKGIDEDKKEQVSELITDLFPEELRQDRKINEQARALAYKENRKNLSESFEVLKKDELTQEAFELDDKIVNDLATRQHLFDSSFCARVLKQKVYQGPAGVTISRISESGGRGNKDSMNVSVSFRGPNCLNTANVHIPGTNFYVKVRVEKEGENKGQVTIEDKVVYYLNEKGEYKEVKTSDLSNHKNISDPAIRREVKDNGKDVFKKYNQLNILAVADLSPRKSLEQEGDAANNSTPEKRVVALHKGKVTGDYKERMSTYEAIKENPKMLALSPILIPAVPTICVGSAGLGLAFTASAPFVATAGMAAVGAANHSRKGFELGRDVGNEHIVSKFFKGLGGAAGGFVGGSFGLAFGAVIGTADRFSQAFKDGWNLVNGEKEDAGYLRNGAAALVGAASILSGIGLVGGELKDLYNLSKYSKDDGSSVNFRKNQRGLFYTMYDYSTKASKGGYNSTKGVSSNIFGLVGGAGGVVTGTFAGGLVAAAGAVDIVIDQTRKMEDPTNERFANTKYLADKLGVIPKNDIKNSSAYPLEGKSTSPAR